MLESERPEFKSQLSTPKHIIMDISDPLFPQGQNEDNNICLKENLRSFELIYTSHSYFINTINDAPDQFREKKI